MQTPEHTLQEAILVSNVYGLLCRSGLGTNFKKQFPSRLFDHYRLCSIFLRFRNVTGCLYWPRGCYKGFCQRPYRSVQPFQTGMLTMWLYPKPQTAWQDPLTVGRRKGLPVWFERAAWHHAPNPTESENLSLHPIP